MSDPTIEEDSLISQDDIDKLLDSSSVKEAEDKLSSSDTESVDELGELSQDDIDQLMNSNVTTPEASINDDDLDDDDMELISQDDIDQLMNSSMPPKEPEEPKEEGEPGEYDELISQDDINNLMKDQAEDTMVGKEAEIPAISDKKEENNTVENSIVEKASAEGTPQDKEEEDEYTIGESEAVDVEDCLITQDTLDDLIKNFNDGDPELSEPVVLDEEPSPDADDPSESLTPPPKLPDPPAGKALESDKQDVQEEIPLDDTEDFLKPDADISLLDFDDDEDEDVSQEDIDALLLESDDEDEEEDDILISQDDIDTLLMAADQEDEDVLGDLTDNEFEAGLDDDIEDEDMLGNDSSQSDDETSEKDQVVLEGDEDELPAKSERKKTGAASQWYKSKLVIAGASALIFLGISVPLTYFTFFSGESNEGIQVPLVEEIPVEMQREIEIETVDVHVKEPVKRSGNLVLKDFVILASDMSKDMAYITADISIDYSDQRAYHEIQNNLSFYRDLIYDSINRSFASEKRDKITETDILWIVETALKKVLPGHYIDRVSFKSFKAS